MKTVILVLMGFSTALAAWGFQSSGSETVDVEITLAAPSPSCSITLTNDLSYGNVVPGSSSGSVTISSTTGDRTHEDVDEVSGSATVGQVEVAGNHGTQYVVEPVFPTALEESGGDTLTYSYKWASSDAASSGYVEFTTETSDTNTGTGTGHSFTKHYRFGGTVSGIETTLPTGAYDGEITVAVSCS